MTPQLSFIALGFALVAGCAAQPDQAEVSADHPANPSAAEAPVPPPSQTLSVADGGARHDGQMQMQMQMPDAAAGDPGGAHQQHGTSPKMPMQTPGTNPAARAKVVYTCPHHPEVVSDKPGKCPKCAMTLRAKAGSPATSPATPGTSGNQGAAHGDHGAH